MKWPRKIFTIILGLYFLVRLKMDDELTLVLPSGPWTGKLESVTDFQIIEIYDHETIKPATINPSKLQKQPPHD